VSAPVSAGLLEGDDAILKLRRLCGPTDVKESLPGTIRGDLCWNTRLNIIHASDSPESAAREIALYFAADEFFPWSDGNDAWF